jgi:probable F420-dependent oxidoreductase
MRLIMDRTEAPLHDLCGTVGLWTFAADLVHPREAGALAATVESLGYSALWFPEAVGREAFTSAMLLLEGTSSLVVGTGIASIYARDPFSVSSAARTLAAFSDNRFICGLGVSHQPSVEGFRGQTYGPPVASMAAYLDALAALSPGSAERGTEVPLLLAALGPKMLELAATKTAGALPYLVTPAHTALARATLGPDAFLAVEQAVVLSPYLYLVPARRRQHLSIYTGLPNYQNNWRRLGFSEEDFIPGGSDRLGEALVVHGDLETIDARVQAHFDAGADHVCVQILGAEPFGPPPLDDWATLAALTEVRR